MLKLKFANKEVQMLGKKLRELRQEKLLSCQQLANETGLSKATIMNIELNKHRPSWKTLRKLALYFGKEALDKIK